MIYTVSAWIEAENQFSKTYGHSCIWSCYDRFLFPISLSSLRRSHLYPKYPECVERDWKRYIKMWKERKGTDNDD